MKHLRQLGLGFFLILALSIPVFAGDIHTPGFTDGPQESPGVTGETPDPGIIHVPGLAGEIDTPGINGDMGAPGLALIFSILF